MSIAKKKLKKKEWVTIKIFSDIGKYLRFKEKMILNLYNPNFAEVFLYFVEVIHYYKTEFCFCGFFSQNVAKLLRNDGDRMSREVAESRDETHTCLDGHHDFVRLLFVSSSFSSIGLTVGFLGYFITK